MAYICVLCVRFSIHNKKNFLAYPATASSTVSLPPIYYTRNSHCMKLQSNIKIIHIGWMNQTKYFYSNANTQNEKIIIKTQKKRYKWFENRAQKCRSVLSPSFVYDFSRLFVDISFSNESLKMKFSLLFLICFWINGFCWCCCCSTISFNIALNVSFGACMCTMYMYIFVCLSPCNAQEI